MNVVWESNGVKFNCSAHQAVALERLSETNPGGFARVDGYVATSGRVTPETANVTALTRLNVSKLYQRRKTALEALTYDAVLAKLLENGGEDVATKVKKLSEPQLQEAFEKRKADAIATLDKTLSGDRDDAHRQGHDRCYATVADGVKVHFLTEKRDDGLKHPVLATNGLPTAESIMLQYVQIKKDVLVEGSYKPVNSGVPVLIGNTIESMLPKSTQIKQFSLKDDNFVAIKIGGDVIVPDEIRGDYT